MKKLDVHSLKSASRWMDLQTVFYHFFGLVEVTASDKHHNGFILHLPFVSKSGFDVCHNFEGLLELSINLEELGVLE